jgi:hypothetical protein
VTLNGSEIRQRYGGEVAPNTLQVGLIPKVKLEGQSGILQFALSAGERVALALRLGDDDLEVFRAARGLGREEALRALRRARQAGRHHCGCLRGAE